VFAANSSTSPLVADPDNPGCYALIGPYRVFNETRGQLQMYTEVGLF
jgi:hypothetical protein